MILFGFRGGIIVFSILPLEPQELETEHKLQTYNVCDIEGGSNKIR